MVQLIHPPTPRISPRRTTLELGAQMAMSEINKHSADLSEWFFWRFGKGPTITVKWPVGWVVLAELPDGSKTSTESADPNDHFRPWLEKNVGRQNRDWAWKIGPIMANNGLGTVGYDTLMIKFRKSKAMYATMAVLLWA